MDERARARAGDTGLVAPPQAEDRVRGVFPRIVLGASKAIAGLTSLAVLGAMGWGWWTFGDVDKDTVTTDVIDEQVAAAKVPLDGAVDMLLVGMDSRTDAYGNPLPKEVLQLLNGGKVEGERNTDTMILVHIPQDGTKATAISFPRDSYVDIGEGFGKRKLNSAFANAWADARQTLTAQGLTDAKEIEAKATIAGRKNLISTIEKLVGNAVTIERYAEVNLASFYEVTKAIGGVEVCLNNAVNEPKSGANLPAGRQTISGAAALSFVRQRYGLPNGDLDRIIRQQVFLAAIANRVLSADMLTNPSTARDLVSAVQRSVILSKGWELTTFAAQMQGLSSGNIEFHTIPTQGDAKIGGADVIKVDPEQVHDFVAGLIGGSGNNAARPGSSRSATPSTNARPIDLEPSAVVPSLPSATTAGITVDVRNGSTTKGLATSVLSSLTGLGFGKGEVGDTEVQVGSVIRYRPGERDKASRVATSLRGRFSLQEDRTLPAGHVRVVLGTDYDSAGGNPDGLSLNGPGLLRLAPPTATPTGTSGSGSKSSVSTTTQPTKIEAGHLTCVN